jgi:putative glutamine amidotransferase
MLPSADTPPGSKPRPRIGVTLDAEPPGGYSKLPWYALRANYFRAIARAGGLPLALPHEVELADAYLDLLDGLVVTGGAFDVDPALYGDPARHPTVKTKDQRTAFELAITRAALARDLPVLGICGGQQLLNVVLGGDLVQHIPDAVEGALAHEQPNPRTEPGHEVQVVPGSRLHAIAGTTRLEVNSAHHQAASRVGAGVVVSGRAPDGVIEAIEAPGRRFCVGVQWHPEYGISVADDALFDALIAACRKA